MGMANSEPLRKKILVRTAVGRPEKKLVGWLKDAGYEAVVCDAPGVVVSAVADEAPGLVILSGAVEHLGQHRAVRELETDDRTKRVPILMLLRSIETASDPAHRRTHNIDFMVDPPGSIQLLARVRAMLRVADDDEKPGDGEQRDGLTKLYNRRYLDERIAKEIERARRYARHVSCIMVDIDNFQIVNSTHGYRAGDEVLKALADILLAETRMPDIVARFGSEEFVVILPETSGADAAALAERLRRAFADRVMANGGEEFTVTISCGVATYPDHARDAHTLLRMADSAVYQAKQEGRNRTVVAFAEKEGEAWGGADTGPTILLVEDNDYNRTVASLVLRASGYEVIEASDGATAIALAQTVRPDLVIIDVHLHGMSGLEATKELVELEAMKDIPVVALTTRDMPGDLERLVAAGCRGYITKPIDTNNLATQIEGYLHG